MYQPSLKLNMEILNLAIGISTLAERCSGYMEGRPCQKSEAPSAAGNFLGDYDVYSLSDFLKAHGDLMGGSVADAGSFRKGNGCVFNDKMCIHLAPPAATVPYQMRELFQWLQKSEDHPLIRSCVFHYALDYIRPFGDGNGKMGRLWQSLLLKEHSPILAMVLENTSGVDDQKQYYLAFVKAIKAGDSSPFVEYLLQNIYDLLKKTADSILKERESFQDTSLSARDEKILEMLREKSVTVEQISKKLKVSSRTVERAMSKLQQNGVICREGSDKTGRWRVL